MKNNEDKINAILSALRDFEALEFPPTTDDYLDTIDLIKSYLGVK